MALPERSSSPRQVETDGSIITSEKVRPAYGIGDPLVWSLLVCALAAALVAFILLRDRSLPPVGGFGGPGTDRGFPTSAGDFVLKGVKQVDPGSGKGSYLVATYQRGLGAPLTIEYHPLASDTNSDAWLGRQTAPARASGAFEEKRGPVEGPPPEGKKAQREGTYVFIKGDRPGEASSIVWTQEIAGTRCGFMISAPTIDLAKELRSQFPTTRVDPPSPTPQS